MYKKLMSYLMKPDIYQMSDSAIWEDEHISKGMLECFLDPEAEAPSFKHSFIDKAVDWITSIVPPDKYPRLLDLGCGAGLFTERFYKKGYKVSGIDFAKRSIDYANKNAKKHDLDINYMHKNYMEFQGDNEYDVITLISCDFGVLSDSDRKALLERIYSALKPGGIFIVDVFTPEYHVRKRPETKTWDHHDSCFMCGVPHICIKSHYRYDECNTFCDQYIIVKEDFVDCFNIWEHVFTAYEITRDLSSAGFTELNLFSHCDGTEYSSDSEIICVVAKK